MGKLAALAATMMAQSMDWRFLPELPASGHALLLGTPDEGLSASFIVVAMPYPPDRLPDDAAPFDLIALPDGLPAVPLLPELAQRLQPDGALYLSFASPWKRFWRPRRDAEKTPGRTLRCVQQQLVQAGLQPIAAYGALPDHVYPAYLFPLTPAALQYVFQQTVSLKFTRRRASVAGQRLAHILTHPVLTRALAHFLPAYAVIGKRTTGAS